MVSSSRYEVLQNLTQKSNTEIEANISHLQTSLLQNDDVISDNLDRISTLVPPLFTIQPFCSVMHNGIKLNSMVNHPMETNK